MNDLTSGRHTNTGCKQYLSIQNKTKKAYKSIIAIQHFTLQLVQLQEVIPS